MKKINSLYLAPLMATSLCFTLAACDSNPQQTQVEKAQQNLMNVRAQAAQDVQAAEKRLSDVIVDTQDKLNQARNTLNQSTDLSKTEGTVSGATSPADPLPPVPAPVPPTVRR